ncbi:unnamed protein product [Rotaria sp. Silwood1]|nr:unnamed protein product [Rotaria sp. Silwood1]CAF0755519.1 unnamed protein product [Rotaria sp. Silwood1]CAF3337276.1 unnamed protein product [Rotaria sp. Silwood1]CAF3354394.1 unnamed protein product [Rotaria sp. Silwood1]CAF4624853.1 unnamed protein product [Rotaria sp. Silwood1]
MLSKMIRQCQLYNNVHIKRCFVRSLALNSKENHEKVKFDSIAAAYGYKSKYELFRGWFVFKLCSYSSLVNRLSKLLTVLRTILGQRLFEYIIRSTLYGHFVAGTDKTELKPIVERLRKHRVKLILDYCMESDVTSHNQQKNNSSIWNPSNEDIYNENLLKSIKNVQTAAELCGSSAITAIKITAFVPPNILQKLNQILEQEQPSTKLSIVEFASNTSTMNKDELTEVNHLIQRINRIIQEVKKHNGKIFIDAEQSYFQTAIHKLVLEFQEQYNRDNLIVYNTYQCYRKTTLDLLRQDLSRSKTNNFHIGIKLVRGAYMDQERKRAAEMKIIDPIHPNFLATTESYHRALFETLQNAKNNSNKTHVFVASHNENTVEFALKTMDTMNIKRNDGIVSFATLFGMCDYLTFPLAAVGYDAYKLTPYGPIHRLLPYLTRRAQENRAIFAKAEKDRRLHYKALKERILE